MIYRNITTPVSSICACAMPQSQKVLTTTKPVLTTTKPVLTTTKPVLTTTKPVLTTTQTGSDHHQTGSDHHSPPPPASPHGPKKLAFTFSEK